MMSALALAQSPPRFVRRTTLKENEYRTNFKQIDNDVIATLVSREARAVTPQMSAIYLGLLLAPPQCWERDGVLHLVGEDREEGSITAWEQMRELTGVANSTLSKALDWMHQAGVIGYDARANGVGVRIFINRASASIRSRSAQKNLRVSPAPSIEVPAPSVGVGFKRNIHERDLDMTQIRADARDSGSPLKNDPFTVFAAVTQSMPLPAVSIGNLVKQLVTEFQPKIAAAVKHESAGIKDWLLNQGLPKATRVAQRETYDLLRAHGVISKKRGGDVGRQREAPEQGRAVQSEQSRLAAFIVENDLLIQEASTSLRASGEDQPADVCLAASGSLGELHHRLTAGDPLAVDEIEARLSKIDAAITDSLWTAIGPADREALLGSSRRALQTYAAQMEPTAFDELVHHRVRSQIRETRGIPALSLFYA
ncbi:MAG TPA: hypothetical protein VJ302_04340 [Blastocatellia bacterium]|nr:hypothetical protein [Blastocatellia bacterium]